MLVNDRNVTFNNNGSNQGRQRTKKSFVSPSPLKNIDTVEDLFSDLRRK